MKTTPMHSSTMSTPVARFGIVHQVLLALYEVAWFFFIAGWAGVQIIRQGRGAKEEITQRLGYVPCRPPGATGSRWIHAVSVGELLSIRPVIDEIKRQSPTTWLLLTTSNEAAYQMAMSRPTGADAICRTPWDSARCVRRALARCRPEALAIVECEIWPNLIRLTASQNRSVLMINARIYERDFPNYQAARFVFEPILRSISAIYTQSVADQSRFLSLGTPAARVHHGGNTKFDAIPEIGATATDDSMRQSLGLADGPLVILASTHEDEEKQILESMTPFRAHFPKLQVLIAPRDITRAERVELLAKGLGLEVVRRSFTKMGMPRPDVVILDTLGELVRVLAWGDVVFVGGSLVEKGGHNPIEPAAWSKPVLMGPHFGNFDDIVEAFREQNAVGIVQDATELCHQIDQLLSDPMRAKEMGSQARKVVERHRGTAKRYAEILLGNQPKQIAA